MHAITLPSGERVPPSARGLGRWAMIPRYAPRRSQLLGSGLDLGADSDRHPRKCTATAEARNSSPRRSAAAAEQAFVVTKVYPHNASEQGCIAACERSLRRLETDRNRPVFAALARTGAARADAGGVSRFCSAPARSATTASATSILQTCRSYGLTGGQGVATNQLLYNLARRGIGMGSAALAA